MTTLLTELVRKQSAMGLLSVFTKTVDKVVEDMATDILRADPAFRKELEQLVRTAFQQALKELQEPAPEKELPEYRHLQLDRLERRLDALEKREKP